MGSEMMKGYINEDGLLFILRGRKYKKQICPYINSWKRETRLDEFYDPATCGDRCPHFEEPIYDHSPGGKTKIYLCHNKALVFNVFEDFRAKPKSADDVEYEEAEE